MRILPSTSRGIELVAIRMSQRCEIPSILVQSGVISVIPWMMSSGPCTVFMVKMRRPYSSNGWIFRLGPTPFTARPMRNTRCDTLNRSLAWGGSWPTSWTCRLGKKVRRRSSSNSTINCRGPPPPGSCGLGISPMLETIPSLPDRIRPSLRRMSVAPLLRGVPRTTATAKPTARNALDRITPGSWTMASQLPSPGCGRGVGGEGMRSCETASNSHCGRAIGRVKQSRRLTQPGANNRIGGSGKL